MISSKDFDLFLKKGFIEGIEPGESMINLISRFGDDYWYVKNLENNGKIYGIIKIGITEFHIYDEKIIGLSYRPDILFDSKDYKKIEKPWVIKNNKLNEIIEILNKKGIKFTKYTIEGPCKSFATAGAEIISLDDGIHHFIDTEGGVTFMFESIDNSNEIVAYQICKYYKGIYDNLVSEKD